MYKSKDKKDMAFAKIMLNSLKKSFLLLKKLGIYDLIVEYHDNVYFHYKIGT